MKTRVFRGWGFGFMILTKYELWPFVNKITLIDLYTQETTLITKKTYPHSLCSIMHLPSGAFGCIFWDKHLGATTFLSIRSIHTKADVLLDDVTDMKQFLLL